MKMSRTLLPHRTLSPYLRSKHRSSGNTCQFKVRAAPAYTQKRFVNAAYSKHVRLKADNDPEDSGESLDASESDEDEMDEQLRAIYATKSKRPPPKPNKMPVFPLIPKEQYDPLPEEVKDVLRKQHEYYRALAAKFQSGAQQKASSSRRKQHYTTMLP